MSNNANDEKLYNVVDYPELGSFFKEEASNLSRVLPKCLFFSIRGVCVCYNLRSRKDIDIAKSRALKFFNVVQSTEYTENDIRLVSILEVNMVHIIMSDLVVSGGLLLNCFRNPKSLPGLASLLIDLNEKGIYDIFLEEENIEECEVQSSFDDFLAMAMGGHFIDKLLFFTKDKELTVSCIFECGSESSLSAELFVNNLLESGWKICPMYKMVGNESIYNLVEVVCLHNEEVITLGDECHFDCLAKGIFNKLIDIFDSETFQNTFAEYLALR